MITKSVSDATGSLARALPQLAEIIAVTLVIAVLAVGLQLKSHCYSVELSSDDVSHYVSGLAIHDYFLSGLGSSPVAFIKNFQIHYPLLGLGHWGPVYYFVEALWMLIFSTSLTSVLALAVTITIATALGIYTFARQTAGRWPALFAACIFVLVPSVQVGTCELMLDLPIALFCLGATYAYGRYLEGGLIRHSVAFALIASAAMLIKGNAASLALLPPLSVLFARRFDLLRKPSFWLPAPIVAVLVGPWYVLTYGMVTAGFRYQWGWHYIATAVPANSGILLASLGPAVLAAAFLGVCAAIARAWTHRAVPSRSAACALLLSGWIFQSVAPAAIQDRYLAPLLPPLLILTADGVMMTAGWLRQHFARPMPAVEAGLSLLLALTVVPIAIAVPVKPSFGLMAAAQQVWRKLPVNNRAVLVAMNGNGESAAIAALAMRDPHRPSLFVIRGTRLLANENKPRFEGLEAVRQVVAAIDDYAIPLVLFHPNFPQTEPYKTNYWDAVVDQMDSNYGTPPLLHVDQVAEGARRDPARWLELARVPSIGPDLVLFGIRGNENKPLEAKRLKALNAPRGFYGGVRFTGQ